MHVSGHVEDYLYYRQPLRGDFTVDCEITSFGYREIGLLYGGAWSKLRYDLKTVERGAIDGTTTVAVAEEQTKPQTWYPLRLEVAAGKVRVLADGKLVDTYDVPQDGDPWLAVHSSPHNNGGVRNLRIGGAPVVPESVPMFGHPDLRSWRPSYFGEPFVGNAPAWTTAGGGEVVGAKYGAAGQSRQSLLRYHRPLVEDGEVDYEFLYAPGETEVHPALDRVVFLLETTSIKTHWLTDEPWDRTGSGRHERDRRPRDQTSRGRPPAPQGGGMEPGDVDARRENRAVDAQRHGDRRTDDGGLERSNVRAVPLCGPDGSPCAERGHPGKVGYDGSPRRRAGARDGHRGGARAQDLVPDGPAADGVEDRSAGSQTRIRTRSDHGPVRPETREVERGWGVHRHSPERKAGRTDADRHQRNHAARRLRRHRALQRTEDRHDENQPRSWRVIRGNSPGPGLYDRRHGVDFAVGAGQPVADVACGVEPVGRGPQVRGDAIRVPDTLDAGTFRVIRRGGLVYGFFKPTGESAWRLVEQRPVGVSDVSQFGFYASVWDNMESRTSVTLEEITIRAEEIVMPRGK